MFPLTDSKPATEMLSHMFGLYALARNDLSSGVPAEGDGDVTDVLAEPKLAEQGSGTGLEKQFPAEVTSLALEFGRKPIPFEFSPASIQGSLLNHRNNPQSAIASLEK
ncbi:uncharacterized protein FTOL_05476 [Fusarium torulosum]|uniref:Mitochondrial chaperone BCS1-like ATPase lid domain-containing protein n=1 Tax=Fusarium torulosum TaxID=33205 RepID=A0AAE8M7U8_9HYPO|nr:uncharacterized protein FTOL_05476 [Fusarium torulosum]